VVVTLNEVDPDSVCVHDDSVIDGEREDVGVPKSEVECEAEWVCVSVE
jgi:hypothetical protein